VAIYLDYAATTPVDPRVAAVMAECLTNPDAQANPASATHGAGLAAHERVEAARREVAALIGATPREIIFTSGATESNNLVLLGVAQAARRADGRGHIVSARTEHRSVLDACQQLQREGFGVTLVEPDAWGRVSAAAVAAAMRADTLLVSVMHANNELGCVNDLEAIAAVCSKWGVLFHTDASQSCGKLPLRVAGTAVDFLSLSAHKLGGPKGVGALYVRETVRPKIAPILFGGGHERGLRPGTLATHQIVGLGMAAQLAREELGTESARVGALRDALMAQLDALPGVQLNSPRDEGVLPGIVNASFEGVEGESLVTGLQEIAVSTGSACSSATREPSYVLRALGRSTELAQSSLRISLGRFTNVEDIDAAVGAIQREVSRLRVLAGGSPIAGAAAALPEEAVSAQAGGSLLARSLNQATRRHFLAAPRIPHFASGTAPPGVRHGRAGRRSDGTEVFFELEIASGFVKTARFSAYGCPHTLAVVAWLCEVMEGARLEAVPPGTPADWALRFEVPAVKLGRLLIVEDALRAALAG